MTKQQLVNTVQKNVDPNLPKTKVERIIDSAFEEIRKAVKKEKRFSMVNFGVFNVRHRKARRGTNPNTGKPIQIPASRTVYFKPAPVFKKGL